MRRSPVSFLVLAGLLVGCAGRAPSAEDTGHLDRMAEQHAEHTPVANGATLEPRQDVVSEDVTYRAEDGRELKAYLARPIGAPAVTPAVILIHEWWGLNDNIRMMARRVAGEGYAALAVDLYGGRVAETPEEARGYTGEVAADPDAAIGTLEAAAAFLRARGARRVGMMGWCFGGGWSLRGALAMGEEIDAAVMYYGQPIVDPARLAGLEAPLQGHFGGEDGGIPVARVREMQAALRELGKAVDVHVYPGARHAFANPSGQAYEPAAAAEAWDRTISFFARELKGE
ncbi:MAG: dienelactone hydrolase family protein [Gemmatimonadota bacterium]|nr:dienelactone hydrolase family protein [Gemmatimonadota bacterium]